MKPTAEWTFMVYLAGDNNLSAAGDTDVAEMRSVGSSSDVNVIVQFDNVGNMGTKRFLVQKDGANEAGEALGETDSGSPEVLTEFVEWTADRYPAKRYALVLWNHGGGWEPSEMDRIARQVGALNYNSREAVQRSATPLARAFFRPTIEKIMSLPSPGERAICSDDGSGHSLDTIELGNVLDKVVKKLGQPLDLLGMDACLMSNLEVAYQVQPYVRYIVASEESEPNEGWPYEQVLRQMVDHPAASTPELATHIVHAYIKSYKDRNYEGSVTQASVNPSKVDKLVKTIDELADALIAGMPEAADHIWKAQRKSNHFFYKTLWDLTRFCEELEKLTDSDRVRKASKEVRAALVPGPDNFVIAESDAGEGVKGCGGVSIYLLPALDDISRYYGDLEFAKKHKWLKMLEAYHSA